jgi:hypothetical protein
MTGKESNMCIQNKIVHCFVVALTIASAASAQRRPAPAMPAEASVAITLQVAGQPYRFEGNGTCRHAPVASIYNVMAEMWGIQQSDGQRSITLTLWRPRSASGDMVSLSVVTGGKSYLVNTVKPDRESAVAGSGNVTLTTAGAGGTFTIKATAVNGAAITGTIKCSAFTAAMAEGG